MPVPVYYLRLTGVLLITLLLAVVFTPFIKAADGVVGNGTPASCTEAELKAEAAAGGTITFDCGGDHTITINSQVEMENDTILDGGGKITLDGQGKTRLLYIKGRSGLTVKNMRFINGYGVDPDGHGGAIRGHWRSPITVTNSYFENNDGTHNNHEFGGGAIFVHASHLLVKDSTFIGNKGANGGAIGNLLSNLTVVNSTFRENNALGTGGAIYTDGASEYTDDNIGGQILIQASQFISNTGAGEGGGVFSFVYPPDEVVIEDSVFTGNVITKNSKGHATGGGLRHGNGDLTIRNTTFAYNVARSQGGGFWTDGRYPGQLTNVTFAHNRAVENEATGQGGLGGAIAGSGNWTCTHCTIAYNHAGFVGGAIFGGDKSDTTLNHTLVAYNTAFNDGKGWDKNNNCAGELKDGGFNLQYPDRNPNHDGTQYPDPHCTANIQVADPLLDSLADNGGPAQTFALKPGSPAIDGGAKSGCAPEDQRGVPRPVGAACDIGAYEDDSGLAIKTLLPPFAKINRPGFILTVRGTGFETDSQVRWNGSDRTTTYVSPFQLEAEILAGDLTSLGEVPVTVYNPSAGETSSPATFQVVDKVFEVYLPLIEYSRVKK